MVRVLIWGVRLHECEYMENLLNFTLGIYIFCTLDIYALLCR